MKYLQIDLAKIRLLFIKSSLHKNYIHCKDDLKTKGSDNGENKVKTFVRITFKILFFNAFLTLPKKNNYLRTATVETRILTLLIGCQWEEKLFESKELNNRYRLNWFFLLPNLVHDCLNVVSRALIIYPIRRMAFTSGKQVINNR